MGYGNSWHSSDGAQELASIFVIFETFSEQFCRPGIENASGNVHIILLIHEISIKNHISIPNFSPFRKISPVLSLSYLQLSNHTRSIQYLPTYPIQMTFLSPLQFDSIQSLTATLISSKEEKKKEKKKQNNKPHEFK